MSPNIVKLELNVVKSAFRTVIVNKGCFLKFILLYILFALTVQDGALCFLGLHTQGEGHGGVLDGGPQVTAGAGGLAHV